MSKKIAIKDFEKQIAIYGSNFHLWEGYDADMLRDFITENDDALSLYLDAQELDGVLDDYIVPKANPEVIVAAKAQIMREAKAQEQIDVIKPQKPHSGALWGLVPKPVYAMACMLCVLAVFVAFNIDTPQDEAGKDQSFQLAAMDALIDDLEELERQDSEQQEMMIAFAEIEKEQEIDNLIDNLYLDTDVGEDLPDDLWEYFNQEG